MTDKEIIEIDGINVLKCEHYQYKSLKDCEMRYPESGDCEIGLLNYLFDGNLDMEKSCKDNPNCYFKQLARKTQECEQIKEKYEALKLENEEGYEIVAELKHECEELKKKCNIYTCGICGNKEDCNKLYKTLAEIKEIAENMNNECFYDDFDCKDCDMQNGCTYFNKKQILQKISECEVTND